MKPTVAFVALRAGSKSIPGKNTKLFRGRPLFSWVVNAAASTAAIDHVYIATDDPEVCTCAKQLHWPNVSVIERSVETTTDTASTESALLEFADAYDFSQVVLLQATSPLLSHHDLVGGLELFRRSGADSLLSCVIQKRFIWQHDGKWGTPVNYDPSRRPRRQDSQGFLVENGAFYICTRTGLLRTGSRLHGNVAVYVMNDDTYLEIDEPADWCALEAIASTRDHNSAVWHQRHTASAAE
jgi:CMP-N-acetylneuraminic acid synthetase